MANRFLSNIRVNDAYTLPSADGSAGQAIITDGSGNLSFGTVSGGGGGTTASVVYRENFTGDGSTTDFQLTRNITDENITQIYIDGVYQEKDAYSIVNLDTISFTAAPPSGDSIEVLYFYAIDAIPQPSTSIIYRDNFTGDGSTTAFTLANSIAAEDHTQVYIDGAYQEKSTYTAVGTSLTFNTAPASGHSVEVISIAAMTQNYSPTTIHQDNFTGDGTTTVFAMQNAVDNEVKTMVYFDGVYQFKGTYTVSGVNITFDTAPSNGVLIEVITIASSSTFDYDARNVLFYGKASGAISKGDAVMFAGQEGDHFLLAKATQAAISSNHEYFLGLATQDLSTGDFGYVTEFGSITELDTSGYTAGDILWFDAGGATAGALTTTEPAAPLVKIQVAAVIRSHQNEGVLFVRPTWYHELNELHDVNITSVADKDMLVWDNANGYWENSKTLGDITVTSLSGALADGVTATTQTLGDNSTKVATTAYVDAQVTASDLDFAGDSGTGAVDLDSQTFTIAGTANEIETSASGQTITIGLPNNVAITGNLTVDTNTLYVDATNNRVGIGASSPATLLQLNHSGSLNNAIQVGDIDTIGSNTGIYFRTTGNAYISTASTGTHIFDKAGNEKMRIDSSGNVGIGESSPNSTLTVTANATRVMINTGNAAQTTGLLFGLNQSATAAIFSDATDENLIFRTGGSFASDERMRITSSGAVGIGTSSPSNKLEVEGDNHTVAIINTNDTATSSSRLLFKRNDTTVVAGEYLGKIEFETTDATASGIGASIGAEITNTSARTDLVFSAGVAGSATEMLRIKSQGGITFNGDTAAANALDDYEEGTFTVTNDGDATGALLHSSGQYTKIGNIVYFRIVIQVSSNFTDTYVGGLPFTVTGSSISNLFGSFNALNSTETDLNISPIRNSNTLRFFTENTVANPISPTTSMGLIRASGWYFA